MFVLKKLLLILLLILILIPCVYAEDNGEDDESCGFLGLGCLPKLFFEFVLKIVNLPLQPLLFLVKKLLADEVNIDILKSFWSIIVYIISMLYGLLFMFSGVNLMISGYDAEKRDRAKQWLQNTLVMIFLVQTSFFFYKLLLELTTTLTSSVINMIDKSFFLLTADSLLNIGLEILMGLSYAVVLIIAIIVLSIRYLLVAFGVVALPLGIFLYFFPPSKQYGKLIVQFIIVATIIPFVDALILLMGSQIIDVGTFYNFKIVVMIASFFLVIVVNIMMVSFIVANSSGVVPKGATKLLTTSVKGF